MNEFQLARRNYDVAKKKAHQANKVLDRAEEKLNKMQARCPHPRVVQPNYSKVRVAVAGYLRKGEQ